MPPSSNAGSAATTARYSPIGSAQASSSALATYTRLGAMLASSWCWSTGSSSSRPAYDANDGTNQCGNFVVIAAMSSPPGWRNSDAPQQPESFETVTAKRSSCAPAQIAAL